MTVAWEAVAETIMGQYSDLPFVVAADHVRDGARAVCKATLAWELDCPPLPLAPGQFRYALDTGDGDREVTAVVHADLYMAWREPDMTVKVLEQVKRKDALSGRVAGVEVGWPHLPEDRGGEPRVLMMWEDGEVALAPTPDDTVHYAMRMLVALMPSFQAPGMPLDVYSRMETAIEHATLQRLYAQPQQPWGSSRMADYHGRLRRSAQQRVKGSPGIVQAPARTQVPPL